MADIYVYIFRGQKRQQNIIFSEQPRALLMYNTNRFHFSACVCTVIDHGRRHSVKRTKSHGMRTRLRLVPYFLVFFTL